MTQYTLGPVIARISVPEAATAPRAAPVARWRLARSAPLVNQAVIAGLTIVAAVSSAVVPVLAVTDAASVWGGVVLALAGLGFAALMVWRPGLARAELLVPAVDFIAIGLLRFGTGDARSPFLAAVLLPLVWIAAKPGRQHIVYPLVGTVITFAVPIVLDPDDLIASEMVRLVFVILVFAAVAGVTNELARQADLRLRFAQQRRRQAESEISEAALVQRSLLPDSHDDIPVELTTRGICLPARTVGGDFYDWYPTAHGAAFTLGDVMGKGVAAGMIAAVVRSLVRAASSPGAPEASIGSAAEGMRSGPGADQFTTCFHFQIARDGTTHWVDAGHGLSVLLRADGDDEWLRSDDLPIGVGTEWAPQRTVLGPGDVVVSVSDGVLDLFGGDLDAPERFRDFLRTHRDPDQLVAAVQELGGLVDHEDDVTLLAVRYEGSVAPAA